MSAGLLAIAASIAVLALRKGDARHRLLGRIYAVAILALAATGFFIYETRGALSLFHGVSVIVSGLVLGGIVLSRRSRAAADRHRVWHMRLMSYSVIVLAFTTLAQFWDHLPLDSVAARAVLFLQLPAVASVVLIEYVAMPRWIGALDPRQRSEHRSAERKS